MGDEVKACPLSGEWRHNNGFIFNGTLRVLRGDFDTNPADEFVTEVMDWIIGRLNQRADLAPTYSVNCNEGEPNAREQGYLLGVIDEDLQKLLRPNPTATRVAVLAQDALDHLTRLRAVIAAPSPPLPDAIQALRDFRKWYDEKMFPEITIEETNAVHQQFKGMVDRISASSARGTIDTLVEQLEALQPSPPQPSIADAIRAVERLRDEWAKNGDLTTDSHDARASLHKATAANEILIALSQLQPEPKEMK